MGAAPVPCVVYCHCNSGSRRDAEEALYVLLPHDIGVFCLDFAVRQTLPSECTSLHPDGNESLSMRHT